MPFSTISSNFQLKVLYIAGTKKITPWKIGSRKIAPDPNPNPNPNANSGVNLMGCNLLVDHFTEGNFPVTNLLHELLQMKTSHKMQQQIIK